MNSIVYLLPGYMKKVSIITVNFNQSAVTAELLDSIVKNNDYSLTEIIVVDNGSTVNHIPEWSKKYPDVRFIRNEMNLGFAGGNNTGILAATGDYLFLVNNDTEFTPGLVATLAASLDRNPQIGIVSPKIRYFHDPAIIQYVGYTPMNYYTAQNASPGQYETDRGQYDGIEAATGFAHGAAMMVRKTVIDKAGLMAENFFLYYEEVDWCESFRRAGYEIWVNTAALIYHKESVSVGRVSALKEYFMNRNRILFTRRNAPLQARWFFYFYFILLVVPRNIFRYIKAGNYSFIPVIFRAVWWNISHSPNSTKLGYTLPAGNAQQKMKQ